MQVLGKLEVFENERGYYTAKIASFDAERHYLGTSFIDVHFADGLQKPLKGTSVQYNVKKGYLNSVHVGNAEKSFDKLIINILDADIMDVYNFQNRD